MLSAVSKRLWLDDYWRVYFWSFWLIIFLAKSKMDNKKPSWWYTIGCTLDYSYFTGNYKIVAIDLSKQLVSDADPMSIKQINFTGCLDKTTNASATNFFWK